MSLQIQYLGEVHYRVYDWFVHWYACIVSTDPYDLE